MVSPTNHWLQTASSSILGGYEHLGRLQRPGDWLAVGYRGLSTFHVLGLSHLDFSLSIIMNLAQSADTV
jgi:hypothetical protein